MDKPLKFCNHCGRLYSGTRCSCRKNEKRIYKHDSFYNSKHWVQLSKFIKSRDYLQDRLVMYFMKTGKPENILWQHVYNYVIDATEQPRFTGERLIVHHIVPREDDYSKQYSVDNLITVSNSVHEYIHALYIGNKDSIQQLLSKAVAEELP